ncbi:hypothetical protein BY996DRAFT_4583807 [Phakopsora pachyrhizi]|nr:hypothetical protein BY996DRAFT_4594671 [Phakopsora pachyrhizi]KAI8452974.1 hypothetical protein BY996DRAFT_4583807 [Phakopsora pachyrhizi]
MSPLTLLTTLSSRDKQSILSIATDHEAGHVFGGSQSGDIHVWSLHTYFPVTRLVGHQTSVLCLLISLERSLLFSSSGDTTVRVWDTRCFGNALCIIKPPIDSCGDVLSLAWCNRMDTLYLGFQDASIQWIHLPPSKTGCTARVTVTEDDSSAQLTSELTRTNSIPLSHDKCPVESALVRSNSSNCSSARLSTRSATSHPQNIPCYPFGRSQHHKFFDSLSQADLLKALRRGEISYSNSSYSHSHLSIGSPPTLRELQDSTSSSGSNYREDGIKVLFIEQENSVTYAHFGYIYCLLFVHLEDRPVLVSGSGDSTIKVWMIDSNSGALKLPAKQLNSSSSILSTTPVTNQSCEELGAALTLAARGSTLYSGYQDGLIKIWDLETFTCIRTLFHRDSHKTSEKCLKNLTDVLTMTVLDNGDMFSGCSGGLVIRWNSSFQRVLKWKAHQGSTMASLSAMHQGRRLVLTGGSDNAIKIWGVYGMPESDFETAIANSESKDQPVMAFQELMFRHLSQLVSYPSISSEDHREDCRQAALYLKKTLIKLGADTRLLPGKPGRNPLVLATFTGKSSVSSPTVLPKRRVLYYGHYDVVQPGNPKDWKTPAFDMSGKNGWLYGRGVSDNKGPTLAVAFAISTLLDQRSLDVDVVMLVEGEEETGSMGFHRAVQENKALIGEIDVILVSNSSWLGDETPCMTFGLRGVIHATVKVTSPQPDLHSGMHGGVVHEPVMDLVRVLSSLVDSSGQIQMEGFYDGVKPICEVENELYDRIVEHLQATENSDFLRHSSLHDIRQNLLAKWRQPALSLHKVDVTGPAHSTVIPSSAQASVSIRIVPNQKMSQITSSFIQFLEKSFQSLNSGNALQIELNQTTDWWLGDPKDPYSKAIDESIEEEWGVKPLWIREGGSIPSIPFLENEFEAKAVHFPMGSATDAAHLPNERIRMLNLEKGSNVVAKFLKKVSQVKNS